MKVKELIEDLKKYDWEMNIYIYDWQDKTVDEYIRLEKQVESFKIDSFWDYIWSRIDNTIEQAKGKTKDWAKVIHKDILVMYWEY